VDHRFVNAFNFINGVNGTSGAHALIGGTAYACLGWLRPDPFLALAGTAVAAGALAFLPWNAVRARLFLGDAGSYGLGPALAVLAAYSVTRHIPVEVALASLGLYLADNAWTAQPTRTRSRSSTRPTGRGPRTPPSPSSRPARGCQAHRS